MLEREWKRKRSSKKDILSRIGKKTYGRYLGLFLSASRSAIRGVEGARNFSKIEDKKIVRSHKPSSPLQNEYSKNIKRI
jgi:hypothetical protein